MGKLERLRKTMIDTQALYKKAYKKGATEKQLQKIADRGFRAMGAYMEYKKKMRK